METKPDKQDEIKLPVMEGQRIQVECMNKSRTKARRTVVGVVVDTKSSEIFFKVDNGIFLESFNYRDIECGDIRITVLEEEV